MKQKNDDVLQFRLPKAVKDSFVAYCEANKLSSGKIFRDVIRRHLNNSDKDFETIDWIEENKANASFNRQPKKKQIEDVNSNQNKSDNLELELIKWRESSIIELDDMLFSRFREMIADGRSFAVPIYEISNIIESVKNVEHCSVKIEISVDPKHIDYTQYLLEIFYYKDGELLPTQGIVEFCRKEMIYIQYFAFIKNNVITKELNRNPMWETPSFLK